MEEIIDEHEHFVIKLNPNSPAGKSDERLWDFCKYCDFNNLTGSIDSVGKGHQSLIIHLSKKHGITKKKTECKTKNETNTGFLRELLGERSKDFVEGMEEGIKLYAHMKDGVSYVGTTGKKLKDALEELNEITLTWKI